MKHHCFGKGRNIIAALKNGWMEETIFWYNWWGGGVPLLQPLWPEEKKSIITT